jgi:uncharacterized pyridoxal phosphate-containing UPF0001 family protein
LPPLQVLLEINISGEESKAGLRGENPVHWEELLPLVDEIAAYPHLKLTGLMTMPPLGTEAEESRLIFRLCKELQEYANQALGSRLFKDLSMGTSFDFPVAIEEGATIVRIGEAIMGPRNYA